MRAVAEGARLKVCPLEVTAGPPGAIVWEPTTMFEEGSWETVTPPTIAMGEGEELGVGLLWMGCLGAVWVL